MRIEVPNIDFVVFNDGVCNIYYEDDNGVRKDKYMRIGFKNAILGFKRHFAAKAVNVNISKVIKIPFIEDINTYDVLEINGIGKYEIELIQDKYDTNPPSRDLTLKKIR